MSWSRTSYSGSILGVVWLGDMILVGMVLIDALNSFDQRQEAKNLRSLLIIILVLDKLELCCLSWIIH